MYITDSAFQSKTFLLAVGLGVLLGVIYDFFRLVRLISSEKKHAVFAQDFLFLALSTFLSFIFLLVVNNGSFRFYIFAAILIGFFAYYFTLGTLFIMLSDIIVRAVKKVIIITATVISAPFRLIFKLFGKVFSKFGHKIAVFLKKKEKST